MVTHAGADSDMSIVYFSLTIKDKKKIIKSKKNQTVGEIVKSQLTKVYVIQNIFDQPCVFSEFFLSSRPTLIFGSQIFHKTSVQKTTA